MTEHSDRASRDLASSMDLLKTIMGQAQPAGFGITAAQAGELADLLNRMGRVALKIEGDGFALDLRMRRVARAA